MLSEKNFLPYDHQHPIRWNQLSQSEKDRIYNKTTAVLDAVTKSPGKLIPYEYLNRVGLEHLYHFLVDTWNESHTGKILVLEKGIKYES